ncbi:NADP-dependent malic enzyme [Candidatus Peregrinibacteria bacterium]|jgi:malate dehydrogenase (oxaloacetate-decarboxylating)|nr:NADP-dependent malic enzyme [Candidatus Peregrinibacteria bacterium]MBT4056506.1 NADP-dependent malic enzyme [Candidatus Peregrinibacteria bacterium]
MDELAKASLEAHKKNRGKLETGLKVPLDTAEDMNLYYTPGVAEPCREIASLGAMAAYETTSKWNTIAVVTDGSAVLGLGNIGSLAGLPVMEGKAALFKKFGNVDAVPICLDVESVDEIVAAVKAIAPTFGGINLEDISAPRCFEIEKRLIEELPIPVFHDDQHGTAVVCLAGLINSLKVVEKKASDVRVVISGAGAAGIAITKLLLKYGFANVSLLDSKGLIWAGRDGLNEHKVEIAEVTNLEKLEGGLDVALKGADIFIGVSKPGIADASMIREMAEGSIVFAMSNPDPEIMPNEAKAGGAAVVATGRSDFPNQINNVLVFPGIFRGALDARVRDITDDMKLAAAEALAALVGEPTADRVIPGVFDKGVCEAIAKAVKG